MRRARLIAPSSFSIIRLADRRKVFHVPPSRKSCSSLGASVEKDSRSTEKLKLITPFAGRYPSRPSRVSTAQSLRGGRPYFVSKANTPSSTIRSKYCSPGPRPDFNYSQITPYHPRSHFCCLHGTSRRLPPEPVATSQQKAVCLDKRPHDATIVAENSKQVQKRNKRRRLWKKKSEQKMCSDGGGVPPQGGLSRQPNPPEKTSCS